MEIKQTRKKGKFLFYLRNILFIGIDYVASYFTMTK